MIEILKIKLILIGLHLTFFYSMSQIPTNQDCLGAIPVCQDTYTQNNSYTGQGNYLNEITTGCLDNGEVNDVWYTFTVTSGGNVNFTITPNNLLDDYDWAVYNLTGSNCSQINAPGSIVSCNYSGTPGITGPNGGSASNNNGALGSPYNSQITVNTGDTYVINISNWSSTQNGYTLNFSNSTASIFDNEPPIISSLTGNIICGSNQFTAVFSENVLCNSVDLSDFQLTGPGGPYSITAVNSPACNSGANYDDTYRISFTPELQNTGSYSFQLIDEVTDLCGNNSIPPQNIDFNITGLSVTSVNNNSDCSTNNGSIIASVTGGETPYQYLWDDPSSQTTGVLSNVSSGTYSLTVSDPNGCTTIYESYIGNNQSIDAVINFINPTNCYGDSTGSAEVVGSLGATPFTYQWDDDNEQSTSNAINLPAGTYEITVTSADLCDTTIAIIIQEPDSIMVSTSNDTLICFGDEVIIEANAIGGDGNFTYTWDNGLGSGSSHTTTPSSNTIYIVSVVDGNGCLGHLDSVEISHNTALSVDIFGDTLICQEESTILSAIGSGGNGGPYSYSWTPGGANTQNISIDPNDTIMYSVTIGDICNSIPDQHLTTVNVIELPSIIITADTLEGCEPIDIHFSNDANHSSSLIYSWNINDQYFSDNENPTINLNNDGCYNVELTLTDENGCTSQDDEDCFITVHPTSEPNFTHFPDNATILNPYFEFVDLSENANDWYWEFGDNSSSNLQNPFHIYPDTGIYSVTLFTSNEFGCTGSYTQDVHIDYIFNLYVPTSFTPNNDDNNDYFLARGDGFDLNSFKMRIFDRWGNLLFDVSDVLYSWDGKYLNQLVPQGVYVYRIDLIDFKGIPHRVHGHVTVIY